MIAEEIAIVFKEKYQITPTMSFAMIGEGFVDIVAVRNYIIRQEAAEITKNENKETAIEILAEKYSCSEPTIRTIIYNQCKK
jgi:hypothetical protein